MLLEGIGSDFGLFEEIFMPVKNDKNFIPYTVLDSYCPSGDCGLIMSTNFVQQKELSLFPNPANSLVSFDLPIVNKQSFLQIKDIYGKTIEEQILKPNQKQLIWDCSSIASGVYLYQTEVNGELYRGKIIVN